MERAARTKTGPGGETPRMIGDPQSCAAASLAHHCEQKIKLILNLVGDRYVATLVYCLREVFCMILPGCM